MKKWIITFTCMVAVSLIFLLYIAINFDNRTYGNLSNDKCKTLNLRTVISRDNVVTVKTTIPDDVTDNMCLSFFSVHLNVDIYDENRIIYIYKAGNNYFGSTSGVTWQYVPLKREYAGKEVVFSFTSPYGINQSKIPEVYYGTVMSVNRMIIKNNVVQFFLTIIIIILALVLIVYFFTIGKHKAECRNVLYFGLFSLILGLWAFNEVRLTNLIFNNSIVNSYLAFILLNLMPFPFLQFMRTMYHEKRGILWKILLSLCILNTVTSISLQLLNIFDLHESAKFTHTLYMISVIVMAIYTISEIKNYRLSRLMKINFVCIFILAFSVVVNIVLYYVGNTNSSIVSTTGYIVYLVIMGVTITKDTNKLINKGREAEIYSRLAYTDILTKMGNRTAFARDIDKYKDNANGVAMIMFDLDNLKYFNDTYGHGIGDSYIENAGRIIRHTFKNNQYARCYRIGGDEFCVILERATEEKINSFMKIFAAREERYNKTKALKCYLEIATGYAIFNEEIDASIEDTRNRADIVMYKNKQVLKNLAELERRKDKKNGSQQSN